MGGLATPKKNLRATLEQLLQHNPRFRDGIGVCSFDIFLDPEAVVVHEWRSGLGNRRVGPLLTFRPGQLLVGADEEFLTPTPLDEWIHVEVECGLGREARVPAVYRVVVAFRGQIPDPYDDLPCVYRRFRAFDQSLFLGSSDEDAAHSLDNIRIALR